MAGTTDVVVTISVIAGSTCVAVVVTAGRTDVLVKNEVMAGRTCVNVDTEVAVIVTAGRAGRV